MNFLREYWKYFVFLFTIIIISSIAFIHYFQANDIYGEYRIKIFRGEENITKDFDCFGISFFNKNKQFTHTTDEIISDPYWYFTEIRLMPNNDIYTNEKLEIRIFNSSYEPLRIYETNLNTIENSNYISIVNLGYSHSFVHKMKYVNPTNFLKPFSVFILFAISILLIYVLLKRKRIFSRNISINTRVIQILGLIAYFLLFIIGYQILMLGKVFIFTGFWILSFLIVVWIIIAIKKKYKSEKGKNTNVLIAGVLIAILFGELFLRLFSVNATYIEKRSGEYVYLKNQINRGRYAVRQPEIRFMLSSPEFEFVRKTNSLGLSDMEHEIKKNENDYVIIALGDSFTEGDGAHMDSTWLKFLERKIQNRDSINFRFINAGVSGSDPIFNYILLKDKLLQYVPDLVIVTYGFDIEDIILRGGLERLEQGYKNKLSKTKLKEHFYALSYIFRLISNNILGYNYCFMTRSEYEAQVKIAQEKLKQSISAYQQLANEQDFKLLIVFHPALDEIVEEKYLYWNEVIDYARNNNINCCDLLAYFIIERSINSENANEYFWKIDGHHNAKGYEAFADGVFQAILKFHLLENNNNYEEY